MTAPSAKKSRRVARVAAAALCLAALGPAFASAQGDAPAIDSISHSDAGGLIVLINDGDFGPTVSCSFTYSHDGATPSLLAGSFDGEGGCEATIPGGLSVGSWTVTASVSDGSGHSGSASSSFTVTPDDLKPAPAPPTPPTPPTSGPTGPVFSTTDPVAGLQTLVSSGPINANSTLLSCSNSSIAITDISQRYGHVRILGLTTVANAGRPIQIAFREAGDIVATVVAAADGSFAATVPLPARKLRNRDSARYRASVGGQRTPWLKLSRRLVVNGLHVDDRTLEISGLLKKPYPSNAKVTVAVVTTCGTAPAVIGSQRVDDDGTFEQDIELPDATTGFVVRLTATVRGADHRSTTTYSIARPIQVPPAEPSGDDTASGDA